MELEEARRKVEALPEVQELGWVTAPWGWEDVELIQVVAGPPEWVEDGEDAYAPEDGPVFLVGKDTGVVHQVSYLMEEERLAAMTPVGEGHPPEE